MASSSGVNGSLTIGVIRSNRTASGAPSMRTLKSAGAGWGNVVQFTTYLVHSQDTLKFMAWRLREFPKLFPDGKYPPNTLLIIDRLVGEQYLIEVQTVAALAGGAAVAGAAASRTSAASARMAISRKLRSALRCADLP